MGGGSDTMLQPGGSSAAVVPPPPPPQPASATSAREAAIAVGPTLKAPKPTRGACDDRRMQEPSRPSPPPRSVRLRGRAINALVARAPIAWPLIRGLSHRFWEARAREWGDRVDRSGPEYLAPLAAGLLRVRPEPERALDIGTGLGDAALLVAREFPRARVRGVDFSEEMIRRAQSRIGLDPEGRVAFKVADAANLPYEDESFDLVTQLNVPPFFAEIGRILRPGGFALIAASFGPRTPFYTPDSVLRRGFRRAGLEPIESAEAAAGTYFLARRD
jgi:SAM-dependent methyltransferase